MQLVGPVLTNGVMVPPVVFLVLVASELAGQCCRQELLVLEVGVARCATPANVHVY